MSRFAVIVIPARFASSRFPGKPLANDTGKPLIQHVWERARKASCVDRVVVATDDDRIASAVRAFGGEALMTRTDHPNGASRLAEALDLLDMPGDTIIVNVQGDEPEIDAALIDDLAWALKRDSGLLIATIASPFAAGEDPADPNIVKVVCNQAGFAMYFSRSRIPSRAVGAPAQPLKHVGLYAYRAAFLRRYVAMTPMPMEQAERLEQLRVLEHGERISVLVRQTRHHGIDTPEQYASFVKRWRDRQSADA